MDDNVTLSEFFGKKNVVLYFYPKDETPGCTREACTFRDSYEELTNLGAEVLGVSGQTVASHKSFATHYGLPGRVTYIIDKQGIVRHIFSSQVQAERHVEEAKKTLRELEKEE
jgi:peroxiredoxin Q/BCP